MFFQLLLDGQLSRLNLVLKCFFHHLWDIFTPGTTSPECKWAAQHSSCCINLQILIWLLNFEVTCNDTFHRHLLAMGFSMFVIEFSSQINVHKETKFRIRVLIFNSGEHLKNQVLNFQSAPRLWNLPFEFYVLQEFTSIVTCGRNFLSSI